MYEVVLVSKVFEIEEPGLEVSTLAVETRGIHFKRLTDLLF